MIIDYKDKELTQRYQLMAQTIIPRPIAWIVTTNDDKSINIAPFSYFTGLSSNPPTVIVSVGHKSSGTPKDTLNNIRKNKKCVICMVDENSLEKMHFSSKELDESISEAEMFDIQTTKIIDDFPPMITQTPSAFFCELYQEIELKDSKTIPLVLEIKAQFIDDNIITNKEKITLSYNPLARVGKSYAILGDEIAPPSIS
jgi:flavin reductase (DIM6/NTAB) family NADH-FMN oxidoreductase RutF